MEASDEFKAKVERPNRKSPPRPTLAFGSRKPADERRAPNLSRDFDADFFKLPADLQARIESCIDRLE